MSSQILNGTSCYLIGPIEGATDAGRGWRNLVKDKLEPEGIKCFDPCDKPFIKDINETEDMQSLVKRLRKEGKHDELRRIMKEIRSYDLRLCDLATFGFAYMSEKVLSCGSWEEIFWMAGRLNKPLFFVFEEGKENAPLWLWGLMPSKYIYSSIEEALDMIFRINSGSKEIDSDRWKLLRRNFR